MHVVDILVPLEDNDGKPFPHERYERVRSELIERFGGVTVFSRAPAAGFWKNRNGEARDRMVVFQVMTDTLDRSFWSAYRRDLEERFEQEKLVIRAVEALML